MQSKIAHLLWFKQIPNEMIKLKLLVSETCWYKHLNNRQRVFCLNKILYCIEIDQKIANSRNIFQSDSLKSRINFWESQYAIKNCWNTLCNIWQGFNAWKHHFEMEIDWSSSTFRKYFTGHDFQICFHIIWEKQYT